MVIGKCDCCGHEYTPLGPKECLCDLGECWKCNPSFANIFD